MPDISVPLAVLPQPALVSDEGHRIRAANAPALALLGDDLVGKALSDTFPDFSPVSRATRAVVALDGRGAKRVRVLIRCIPFDGHLLLLLEDVTEQGRKESVVQQEKLAALGRLIAGIAHETNNPLAAISGTAQLLESHPDEIVRADAGAIRRMAERASRVVRSMLTFARGSEDDARQQLTLRSIVEEVLALSEYGLRKADIQVGLRFATASAEPCVWVNPSQIGQVVLNLLSNAEFALRNTSCEERHVSIETRVEGNWALLRVSDNGEGIPLDIQPRIFDPFFTTKEPGEGTGLGLSICHRIATSHKGSLEVESQPGGGSVFTLRLPVMKENRGRVSKTTPGNR